MADLTYAEKLKDPRWQKKRLEIFQRDNWECQQCGSGQETLHAHHREYLHGIEPWNYPNELLVTLCERCHAFETEHMKEYETLLIDTLHRAGFLADDFRELATGFGLAHEVFRGLRSQDRATAINWALRDPDMADLIVSEFRRAQKESKSHKSKDRDASGLTEITKTLNGLLPREMRERTSVAGLQNGLLVLTTTRLATYSELYLCRHVILNELRRLHPKLQVAEIDIDIIDSEGPRDR